MIVFFIYFFFANIFLAWSILYSFEENLKHKINSHNMILNFMIKMNIVESFYYEVLKSL